MTDHTTTKDRETIYRELRDDDTGRICVVFSMHSEFNKTWSIWGPEKVWNVDDLRDFLRRRGAEFRALVLPIPNPPQGRPES